MSPFRASARQAVVGSGGTALTSIDRNNQTNVRDCFEGCFGRSAIDATSEMHFTLKRDVSEGLAFVVPGAEGRATRRRGDVQKADFSITIGDRHHRSRRTTAEHHRADFRTFCGEVVGARGLNLRPFGPEPRGHSRILRLSTSLALEHIASNSLASAGCVSAFRRWPIPSSQFRADLYPRTQCEMNRAAVRDRQ